MDGNEAKPEKSIAFTTDELVMIAHLRRKQFSVRSALERINRPEVELRQFDQFIRRTYGNSEGFFSAMEPLVEEGRKNGTLPKVEPPARAPRNRPLIWGRGRRTSNR